MNEEIVKNICLTIFGLGTLVLYYKLLMYNTEHRDLPEPKRSALGRLPPLPQYTTKVYTPVEGNTKRGELNPNKEPIKRPEPPLPLPPKGGIGSSDVKKKKNRRLYRYQTTHSKIGRPPRRV